MPPPPPPPAEAPASFSIAFTPTNAPITAEIDAIIPANNVHGSLAALLATLIPFAKATA